MNEKRKTMSQKKYWRSLDQLADPKGHRARHQREFREGAETLEVTDVTRRGFMAIMGASAALATGAGCVRKPTQYILPYTNRPEDLIPGEPRFFASTLQFGQAQLGVLVESQDGRPTKVEGNPTHPASQGATNVWAQATVLDVYDPDRSRTPLSAGSVSTWSDAAAAFDAAIAAARTRQGQGLAFLVEESRSAAFAAALATVRSELPQANIYLHDLTGTANQRAALASAGLEGRDIQYDMETAKILVALDADFMGTEGDNVRNARGFANGRRVVSENDTMNRLYAVEPAFTVTGATADNRLQIPASQVGVFLVKLAASLGTKGVQMPASLGNLPSAPANERLDRWADALADDLVANRSASALVVGNRQPAWVHGLGLALNQALGNVGTTVRVRRNAEPLAAAPASEFVQALGANAIQTLVIIGANPVYTAPADTNMRDALGRVEQTFHLGYHADETGRVATWHLPMSHALESWGDGISLDGTIAIQQPLIAPLFDSWSPLDLLSRVVSDRAFTRADEADGDVRTGYSLLRRYWRSKQRVGFETAWQTWLHEGVVDLPLPSNEVPAAQWAWLSGAISLADAPTGTNYEVVFALDAKVLDGRFANNAWMQELPDPITKLTWDNAAMIGLDTARALNLPMTAAYDNPDIPITEYGQMFAPMARISVGGRELTIPLMIVPGVSAGTIVLPLGYGREFAGSVCQGVGFDTYKLFAAATGWIAPGATITLAGGTYELATTQDHGSLEGRPILQEATLAAYREKPDFIQDNELMPEYKLRSLWEEPHPRDGQQWGMSIDLTTCIGCNACTIACQAENNISVVGKREILNGREMTWIRLDRYFSGDASNPEASMQPLACQHCENAPCEQVCPVAATVHGPEGTNDMAYNRCIGTRYCANNCPFKVRRFNFFNYAKREDDRNELLRMQRNPDVTVRFRGVMEKCSYCIQRVNEAKIRAKVRGDGVVQDGAVTPACGQVCPTQAIVFGDINDPNSRVSQAKRRNRDYAILSWLNVHPRTTYLAKIRNPNPALV